MAVLFILAGLAGCGGPQDDPTAEQTPAPTPTRGEDMDVTLGLWGVSEGLDAAPTQWLLDEIARRFGVNFTLVDISALAEDPTVIGTIEMPQVLTHPLFDDRFSFSQLLSMDMIRPIDAALYDQYARVGTAVGRVRAYAALDDEMYFIPRTSYAHANTAASSMAVFYRSDWARQLGKDFDGAPSWEQFMELMRAYTYDDPDGNSNADEWGLTTCGEPLGGIEEIFFASFGVRDWVLEGGQWTPGYLSTRGREALKWANNAYRMGYIDRNFSTMTTDDAIAKFCAGRSGMLAMEATPQNIAQLEIRWADLQPETALTDAVALMAQPVTPYGASYQAWDYFSGGVVFGKGVPDATVDRVLQVLDWLYTSQGLTTAMYGEQGQDYDMGEFGPQSKITDERNRAILFMDQNPALTALAQLSTYAKDGANPAWRSEFQTRAMTTLQETWWQHTWNGPMFSDYLMSMTMATYNPGAMLENEVARMMIFSADVEAEWEDFVARMEDYLVLGPVRQEVNAAAQEKGITAEE